MRDKMERLVLLPFSFGCVSEASVAVGIPHPRRSRPDTNSPAAATKSLSGESVKNLLRFHENVPKSNTAQSFNRLFKGFKNFPQLFVDKEEELEEEETDMEIGCPTNVQHVTHIGWDGIAGTATATSSESTKGWEDLITPQSLSSFPLQHCTRSSLEPKPGTSS